MKFLGSLFRGKTEASFPAEEREITAFFASVDSFVSFSESLSLSGLGKMIESYLSVCNEAVESQGGTVDKYIGDSVVACFGAPESFGNHASKACCAALALQQGVSGWLVRICKELPQQASILQGMRVRVGIHTGSALVGTLGPPGRRSFTMIGDNVNLAAQLNQGAKSYAARIICTGQTKTACETRGKAEIIFRSLGRIVVKGRSEPVQLFEPMARGNDISPQVRECVSLFEQGLARFRAMDWDGADNLFERSAMVEPECAFAKRTPSVVFREWVERARKNPPSRAFLP